MFGTVEFAVVGVDAFLNDGVAGVLGSERFNHALRRPMGVVGVETAGTGGVIGLEDKGENMRAEDAMLRLVGARERAGLDARPDKDPDVGGLGGLGRGLWASGAENAEPMSDKVSERTCILRDGAIAGT